jgi:hypothetical protein
MIALLPGICKLRNNNMKIRTSLVAAFISISGVSLATGNAFAFCGVIQETSSGKNVARAGQKAKQEVKHKVKKLRQQHGNKLQVEPTNLACVGGAVAIDANGNQVAGQPSCTATASFCVNP